MFIILLVATATLDGLPPYQTVLNCFHLLWIIVLIYFELFWYILLGWFYRLIIVLIFKLFTFKLLTLFSLLYLLCFRLFPSTVRPLPPLWYIYIYIYILWEIAPPAPFFWMLGQTHVNGWSRVIASQNEGSTDYIFPFRLRFYNGIATYLIIEINKKTKIEKFLILLI